MALLLLSILLSCFAAGLCVLDAHDDVVVDFSPYNDTWESFKIQYDRNYTDDEEAIRFNTFVERLKMMESHNRDYLANRTSFYMGIGPFTDETDAIGSCEGSSDKEAENRFQNEPLFKPFQRPDGFVPPAFLNWMQYDAVTPVQNQGKCGSCYAFAVTASLEAQMKFATKRLIPLSQQQQVDCLVNGCDGSNAYIAFSYVHKAKGLKTESIYPYTYRTRVEGLPGLTCRLPNEEAQAKVTEVLITDNEVNLLYMVASQGPTYIRFRVQLDFQTYKGGVYDNLSCEGPTNHALTVIGYGQGYYGGSLKHYWIVKNSWGTAWGMNGYGLIERGKGICGIGSFEAVPIYLFPNRGMHALNPKVGCPTPNVAASSVEITCPYFLLLLVLGVKYG